MLPWCLSIWIQLNVGFFQATVVRARKGEMFETVVNGKERAKSYIFERGASHS